MSDTVFDVMNNLCTHCEYYMTCIHLFSPSRNCPYDSVQEFLDRIREEKGVCNMSKAEQNNLIQITKAMSPEEQETVVKALPTQLLYEELGIRLATQAEFIGKIVTTVQEAT